MTVPDGFDLNELAAEQARYRQAALDAQQRMAAVSATVTSSRGLVTVTAGPQGELCDLRFNSQEYRRMAPAELAATLLETVRQARESVLRQLMDQLPAGALGGVSPQDLLDGTVGWSELLPDGSPDRHGR